MHPLENPGQRQDAIAPHVLYKGLHIPFLPVLLIVSIAFSALPVHYRQLAGEENGPPHPM
jgi:hypothetical protein